jgi:hypothetical protein
MNRLSCLLRSIAIAGVCALCMSVTAADMTFQLINDSDRLMSFKFFSRAESRQQWPSRTNAFSISPDAAAQPIKISCTEGELICWGAWITVTNTAREIVGAAGDRAATSSTYSTGVGERGLRVCESCCHICKDGALLPAISLREGGQAAK